MKVSYQWLSEYVDIQDVSAAQLAERLTRSGIEVDIVESRNKGVDKVVVGLVKTCEPHPDADKLRVCTVDVGGAETLQIVCGAPNVAAGQKVPVALIGAVLPGNFRIKRAKLRGVESQGMICSAKELGMNDRLLPKDQQEGILVMPAEIQIGASVVDVLGLQDEVLELDLTPNRSDCLSMIGVAYEIAAILDRDVQLPQVAVPEKGSSAEQHISVRIEDDAADHCRHYAARYIENVNIGPSPQWLQNRLMAAGVRPINNIVDITNYVMLEYGQPLHAFDASRLDQGRIVVRLANDGETMTTLDGVERRLDSDTLLITDGVKPVAIAGVMGGANSEVTSETKSILLESANFNGGSVRRASRKLGLRSEASLRFEKEANPEAVVPALDRAAQLIAEYAGGNVAVGTVSDETGEPKPSLVIPLNTERVNRYLGTSLSLDDIRKTFDQLQFSYELDGSDALQVTVPLRRRDIFRDVDLIEEVARIYGYDLIPTTPIIGSTTSGGLTREQELRREVRKVMSACGLNEAVTYSFTHPQQFERYVGLYPHARPVALAMPMSEERSVLRTSLIPHLIDAAVYNRNRNVDRVAIYELGTVFVTEYQPIKELPEEKLLLGALWTGKRSGAHWSGDSREVDFYDLKGVLERLLAHLGISEARYQAAELPGLHPGRAAEVWVELHETPVCIGRIGQLHPELQRNHDLDSTFVMEVEMAPLVAAADEQIAYTPAAKYPSMIRDMAIVVDRAIAVGDLMDEVRKSGGALLSQVDIFDVYTGDNIASDKKSVALSLLYRHPERTLTDEEVTAVHEHIVSALKTKFAAELRK